MGGEGLLFTVFAGFCGFLQITPPPASTSAITQNAGARPAGAPSAHRPHPALGIGAAPLLRFTYVERCQDCAKRSAFTGSNTTCSSNTGPISASAP